MSEHIEETPVEPVEGGSDALGPDAPADVAAMEVALPMLTLNLMGANVVVHRNPENGDRLIVVGPVLLRLLMPLDVEGARGLGRELTGGIELANGGDLERIRRSGLEAR